MQNDSSTSNNKDKEEDANKDKTASQGAFQVKFLSGRNVVTWGVNRRGYRVLHPSDPLKGVGNNNVFIISFSRPTGEILCTRLDVTENFENLSK